MSQSATGLMDVLVQQFAHRTPALVQNVMGHADLRATMISDLASLAGGDRGLEQPDYVRLRHKPKTWLGTRWHGHSQVRAAQELTGADDRT
ncbi:MAG: hypothetical protein WAL85_14905 [Candidatus Korobacteraceae bacterium]